MHSRKTHVGSTCRVGRVLSYAQWLVVGEMCEGDCDRDDAQGQIEQTLASRIYRLSSLTDQSDVRQLRQPCDDCPTRNHARRTENATIDVEGLLPPRARQGEGPHTIEAARV